MPQRGRPARGWAIAGLGAATALPGAVLAFGAPIGVGLAAAGLAFAAVLGALRLVGERPSAAEPSGRSGGVWPELVADSHAALTRLEDAARGIANTALSARFFALAQKGRALMDSLSGVASPLSSAHGEDVRRTLGYYFPRAADLAEAAARLSRRPAGLAGRAEPIAALAERLEQMIDQTLDGLDRATLQAFDLDLRMLQASLAEDLRTRRR